LARKGTAGPAGTGVGRAMGETMAVLMVAGNILMLPFSWFNKGEPLPALIALELGSSIPGSMHYQALFAAGLVLILMVIAVNLGVNLLLHRLRSGVKPF